MESSTDSPGDHTGPDAPASTQERPPLRRPASGRMLAGVAAGIAAHFAVDVTIVRIGFAVLTIAGFGGLPFLGGFPLYLGGIPLYLACWLLIPEEGSSQSIAAGFVKSRQRHHPSRDDQR